MTANEEVPRRAAVREGVRLEVVTITWMVVEAAIVAGGVLLTAFGLGHARLETTRIHTLPTKADRERAMDALLTDR
jgi:hypothetical protein